MSYTPAYAGNAPHTPERRRQLRKVINALAYIEIGEDNGGLIVDISERGLAVQAAMPLIGDRLGQMRFQLPESERWIETRGRLAWKDKSRKQAGVEFVDLPEEARNQIRDWTFLEGHAGEVPEEGGRVYEEAEQLSTPPTRQNLTSPISDLVTTSPGVGGQKPASISEVGVSRTTPTGGESASSGPNLAAIQSLIEKEMLDAVSTMRAAEAPPVAKELTRPISDPTVRSVVEESKQGLISPLKAGSATPIAENSSSPASQPAASDVVSAGQNQGLIPSGGATASSGGEEAPRAVSLPAASVSDAVKDSPAAQNQASVRSFTGVGVLIRSRWAAPVLAITVIFVFFVAGTAFRRGVFRSVPNQDVAARPAGAAAKANQTGVGDSKIQQPRVPIHVAGAARGENPSRRALPNLGVENRNGKSKLPAWTLSHPTFTQSGPMTSEARQQYLAPVLSQANNLNGASLSAAALGSPKLNPVPPEQTPEIAQQEKYLDPAYPLFRVEPSYPPAAQQQGVEGTVKMHALIGKDGKVKSLTLVSGPPLLVAAAMSAGREWSYLPAILNGQPVESEQDISIEFRLPH